MSELEESRQLTGEYGNMSLSRSSLHDMSRSGTTATQESELGDISRSSGDDFQHIQPNYLVDKALKQCQIFLVPYFVGIKFLGWTQLTKENSRPLQVIRWGFVLFWNLLLLGTFTIQVLTCYTRDRFNLGVKNDTTNQTEIICSENVIFSLVNLDILILITYWFGLSLFSREEKEHMYNLAEKMFIKLTASQDPSSTKPVIGTIWAFIIVGLLWIVFSIVVRAMNAATVSLYDNDIIIQSGSVTLEKDGKTALVTLCLILFIVYDVVYFMAIINYVVQCEMMFFFVHSVSELVKKKQYLSMDAAVKDISDIREKLSKLNGKTAATAAMAILNVASNAIFALDTLDDLRTIKESQFNNKHLPFFTAVFNVILWIVPLVLPFIQAARVSHQCDKLKQTGFYLRTRPFQYSKTELPELDSFLVFTQAAKLRATMCGVPIYPWMVYLALVIVALLYLIILQSDDYNIERYFN